GDRPQRGSFSPEPERRRRPAAGTARAASDPTGRLEDRASGCPLPTEPPRPTCVGGRPPSALPTLGAGSPVPVPYGPGGTRAGEGRGDGPRPEGRPSPRAGLRSRRPVVARAGRVPSSVRFRPWRG